MADRKAVLDWALQFYCSLGDDEMVDDLVRIRRFETKEEDEDSRPPLSLVFHRLRRAFDEIGPWCLGLADSEVSPDESQAWASPLFLPTMAAADQTDKQRVDASSQPPNPFLPQTQSRAPPAQQQHSSGGNKRRATGAAGENKVDIPSVIHDLIAAEGARRRLATEYLRKRQAQGPVADQSERWQHHFAKRNQAEEKHFEDILVALKELAVLQAIAGTTGGRFDAAHGLATLNLMFPLDPAPAAEGCVQRYAFRLEHVASPRTQLAQLLCEVEAWVGSQASGGRPEGCPRWRQAARGFAWAQLRQSGASYVRRAEKKILELHRRMHPWAPPPPAAEPGQTAQGAIDVQARFDAAIRRDNHVILREIDAQVGYDATVIERIARHAQLVRHRFSALAVRDALRKEN